MRRPACQSPRKTEAVATRSPTATTSSSRKLDAIEIESTHTIEIDSFVPRAQIDQRFFDTP
jgi:DNA end-binding protein Ku